MANQRTFTSPLPGQMQHWPLTLDKFLTYAATSHAQRPVVARAADGEIVRSDYAGVKMLAGRIANALLASGINPGDRVATLAMNGIEHLAAWYGIMGIGAVCHTVNPRLFEEQLIYIVNHAGDRLILADSSFASILERFLPHCPTVERVILLDGPSRTGFDNIALEAFIAGQDADFAWGGVNEEAAAGLCYTSGTTGDPKGVLYSHRSNYLHTLNTLAPDAFGVSANHVVMPIVPMFHANAWGMVFTAPAAGAKLVLPGLQLDGRSIFELMEAEGVTHSAGVPTIWQALIGHLEETGARLTTLRRICIGGSACPKALLDAFEARGIDVIHGWGMTELSPMGLISTPTPETAKLPPEAQHALKLKQGRTVGVDARIVDDAGGALPCDGKTPGRLQVRGPAVVARYYRADADALTADGWFDSGDIATIDANGFVGITDRAKDIIKSGGEWISSVEIENLMVGHPAVALAAVIAIPHPKWDERPRLCVQLKPGLAATADEMLSFLDGRIARWWMPDEVVFVDAIPLGATGKIDKKALRALQ